MKITSLALTVVVAAAALAAGTPLAAQSLSRSARAEDSVKPAGEKITLAISMTKGSAFATEAVVKMKQEMQIGGMDIETDMDMTSVGRSEVTDVSDSGDHTVATTVRRIHGSITNPMLGEIAFDSDKPDEESDNPMLGQITKQITASVGQEMSVVMGKDGAAKSAKGSVGNVSGDDLAKAAGGIGLPKTPVGVGDSWSSDTTQSMQGMQMRLKLKQTLKSFDADTAVIEQTGTMEMAADAGDGTSGNPMAAAMAKLKMKSSKIETTITVSRKDGMMLRSTGSTMMEMSMAPDENATDPMAAGGMTMKMTMSMNAERKPASYADKKPAATTPSTPPAAPTVPAPAPAEAK